MQCRAHPEAAAVNTCNQCGNWLCEDCTVNVQGRLYCRSCLAVMANAGSSTHAPPPMPPMPEMAYRAPLIAPRRAGGYRRISWGLLFFFSCFFPSGVNYMYMGLVKRGLAAMTGFFLLIFMVSMSSWPITMLLGFAIPIYFLTCLFDGFNIRRKINAGYAIPDGIDDVLVTLKNNRTLSCILIVVVGLTLLSGLLGFAFSLLSNILPIAVILFGLYIVLKKRKTTLPPQ